MILWYIFTIQPEDMYEIEQQSALLLSLPLLLSRPLSGSVSFSVSLQFKGPVALWAWKTYVWIAAASVK